MKFVYIIENECGARYTGITDNVEARLKRHNARNVPSTALSGPWSLRTFVAFTDSALATDFEKYLKSGSGRAFAKKRL